MQRWTARLLLVLSLVGIIAPAALAMTVSPMHACCLRKGMHCHEAHERSVQATGCCSQNCCRSLTVPPWTAAGPVSGIGHVESKTAFVAKASPQSSSKIVEASYSGRAPPMFFS